MQPAAWITSRLAQPQAHRWIVAVGGVVLVHVLVLGLLAPSARLNRYASEEARTIAPIFLDITPRARAARPPPVATEATGERALDQPPIAVRPAAPNAAPSEVAPLVADIPPPGLRPPALGRVIPQSWRERCGLGEGAVTEAALRACRDSFLQAATPREAPPVRSDPRDGWAAIAARNHARYDYFRSPAPTGSGNAGPSSTPGSNFGWGEMDDSVIYTEGSRPEVNGGIE